MTHVRTRTAWSAFAFTATLALPTLLFTGCQMTDHHEENVNAANDRWLSTRSAMMYELGQQQFDTGDLENASRTVREAITIDPTNARLQVLAGRIAFERGQLERSYHLFNAAIELAPDAAPAFYYRGLVHQRWQQYQEAHDSYYKAYQLQADDSGYLMAAAEMLIELDRTDEAIAMLEQKLTYFGQNAALRAALGHMHAMNGRPDRAATYFERASLLDPDNDKVREELALAQVAAGEMEAAIDTLNELLKSDAMKDRRGLRLALGRAYEETGQMSEAREQYLVLARSDDAKSRDWIRLAELAWSENDHGGTLYAANRAIQLEPRQHEGYIFAGLAWQKRDRLDDALKMFDRAAELAPDEASPLILRGIALQRAGRPGAAAEAYQQALERQPDDVRAQRLLSQVSDAR
ncbi:MAG: tetratricopeptide repeat protein [Phycisphaeraceae bacterium]